MSRAILGIISDTHGLLRTEAVAALAGSDHILHAGDIGGPEILNRLGQLARVTAVRGNVDTAPWAEELPERNIYVLHDRARLVVDPVTAGYAAVVFGHSHKALVETHDGVLYLNPGSAGPRRFRLPITVSRLRISTDLLEPEIVQLA